MSSQVSPTTTLARDVDIRGFVYALEPLRQREQWRMDKAMTALAQAQHALLMLEQQMKQLRDTHDQHAAAIGQGLSSRLDPSVYQRALGYLAHLRDQWKTLDAQRQAQQSARDQLRRECLAHQVRLEGLTRHRDDALTQHAHEVRQRSLSEQDRDWLVRASHVDAGAEIPAW